MKKILAVILIMLLSLATTSFADITSASRIEEDSSAFVSYVNQTQNVTLTLKEGIGYSIPDDKVVNLATVVVAEKNNVNVEVGLAGENKPIIAATYEIAKLKDYIDLPILNLIKFNLGGYYGMERITKSGAGEDYGIALTGLITFGAE